MDTNQKVAAAAGSAANLAGAQRRNDAKVAAAAKEAGIKLPPLPAKKGKK